MPWRPTQIGIRAMTAVVAVGAMLIASGLALLISGKLIGFLGAAGGLGLLYWVEAWGSE